METGWLATGKPRGNSLNNQTGGSEGGGGVCVCMEGGVISTKLHPAPSLPGRYIPAAK